MITGFSLLQLEYLIALDIWRHFGIVADKCFVTQPTLSMQIQKMERDPGIHLFDRSKQPVIPTEAGITVIDQARSILKDEKQFDYQTGSLETLKLMVEMNHGITILPELTLDGLSTSQHKMIRRFKPPAPVREISLVTHRNFVKMKIIAALKSEILNVFQQEC